MRDELIALIKAANKLCSASENLLDSETITTAQDRIIELKLAIASYDEKLAAILNKPQHATDENRG
jgi:hypothetical protein